jgi:hypothetical protein
MLCLQLGAAAESQELAGAQQYLEEETSMDKWVGWMLGAMLAV